MRGRHNIQSLDLKKFNFIWLSKNIGIIKLTTDINVFLEVRIVVIFAGRYEGSEGNIRGVSRNVAPIRFWIWMSVAKAISCL